MDFKLILRHRQPTLPSLLVNHHREFEFKQKYIAFCKYINFTYPLIQVYLRIMCVYCMRTGIEHMDESEISESGPAFSEHVPL